LRRYLLRDELGVVIVLVGLVVIVGLVHPPFMTSSNLLSTAQSSAYVGLMACGMVFPAIVVEEAITAGLLLREELRLDEPGSFHHTVGGGLGWGIGAAVGLSLSRPDRRVVAALGDGCALFGVQGLWSAAHQAVPVTFVVFANGEYRTLKQTLTGMRGERTDFVGMDLTRPTVNWPDLARSLGVPGVRAGSADHLAELLQSKGIDDGPLLVEVPIRSFAEAQ
jgi:benzoylformate decarboxylase